VIAQAQVVREDTQVTGHPDLGVTMTAEAPTRTLADVLEPTFNVMLGGPPPVHFELWDESTIGPTDTGPGTVRVNSPEAIRYLLWAPGELGLGRAFVTGEVDVEGSLPEVLKALKQSARTTETNPVSVVLTLVSAARELGILKGSPPQPPPEEIVPRGVRHSIGRDRQAVSHHYDVGNRFYELVLGPSMTYSCGRFTTSETALEEAQDAKHDLICRKLGLTEPDFRAASVGERPRLVDIGCGWGSMALCAASRYDVDVVGVTTSNEQVLEARRRVANAGLSDRIEIRNQDYREITDGPYDIISSIGMAEHVGLKNLPKYFTQLHALLRPGGRLLNHAISSIGGSKPGRHSFLARYVFPDGELIDVGVGAAKMQQAGFEVRDVENLREHYALTLREWVANLEANWEAAVELVGERRARVWRLYMSGSINGFEDGGLHLHQILGVKPFADGRSGVPPTRAAWV
jgi:cyclopropane-fatty-acyl-phospholipid synthase